MLTKVFGFFSSAKRIRPKFQKSFVNIVCKSDNMKPEEFGILEDARGVIENFAKKNNIKVDIFFKEANVNNIKTQMVDVSVQDNITRIPAVQSIVYKEDNKPKIFITQKPNIRWIKAKNQEYIQKVKSSPMEVTIYDNVEKQISEQRIEMPDTELQVKVYNNYSEPKQVGVGKYEDTFLRKVYRVIEQLGQLSKKAIRQGG